MLKWYTYCHRSVLYNKDNDANELLEQELYDAIWNLVLAVILALLQDIKSKEGEITEINDEHERTIEANEGAFLNLMATQERHITEINDKHESRVWNYKCAMFGLSFVVFLLFPYSSCIFQQPQVRILPLEKKIQRDAEEQSTKIQNAYEDHGGTTMTEYYPNPNPNANKTEWEDGLDCIDSLLRPQSNTLRAMTPEQQLELRNAPVPSVIEDGTVSTYMIRLELMRKFIYTSFHVLICYAHYFLFVFLLFHSILFLFKAVTKIGNGNDKDGENFKSNPIKLGRQQQVLQGQTSGGICPTNTFPDTNRSAGVPRAPRLQQQRQQQQQEQEQDDCVICPVDDETTVTQPYGSRARAGYGVSLISAIQYYKGFLFVVLVGLVVVIAITFFFIRRPCQLVLG